MIYIILFYEFFKVGLFAIGGGLATLPFLQDLIPKYGWITTQELVDMIALSESTPGPIGVNMATYVGYKTSGIIGGIIATVGLVTPSIIVILIIAHYFMKFHEKPMVQAGFYGLRPAVAGLIGAAGFEVVKVSLFNINRYLETHIIHDLFNYKSIIVFLAIIFLTNKYKKHPIIYLVGAALVGIVLKIS